MKRFNPTLGVKLTAGLAAGLTALTMSGCSSGAASGATAAAQTGTKGPITIGFSPQNQSAPALTGLTQGLQAYAKSKGDKVLVADPNNNAATQVQQVTAWIQNKQVQAIWALSINPASMKSALQLAQQNGVAMLALGVPSDYGYSGPQKGISFSTVDYTAYGNALGDQIAKCVTTRLGGKGQVVYLTDPAGAVGSTTAKQAFDDALKAGAPGAQVVSTIDSGEDRLTSQQKTSSALQAHPDANVFVGQNDEATLGALGAVTQAGKDPSKLCIGGTGGNDETLADVKSGKLYVEVALQFDADLAQNVNELEAMARNPSATGTQLTVPIKTVTAGQ